MTINTYFMWDGVAPEDGSSQIDIPWRTPSWMVEAMAELLMPVAEPDPMRQLPPKAA